MLPLKPVRGSPSLPLSAPSVFQEHLVLHSLLDVLLQSLSLSSPFLVLPLCLFSSFKDTSHSRLRSTVLQYVYILANGIYSNPISK